MMEDRDHVGVPACSVNITPTRRLPFNFVEELSHMRIHLWGIIVAVGNRAGVKSEP